MLTIVCALCERANKGNGYVCDLVESRLIPTDEGAPRMVKRGRILSLYMCPRCADKVQEHIHSLRALTSC